MIREHHFGSSREAAEALAGVVADRLRSRLARRERAVLVVSGGTTPIPLFRSLRQEDLPWGRIVVTLADERWVPLDHEDRNERLVRTELLVDRAAEARFVGYVTTAATPEEGAELSERNIAPLQPFDVVVLGMGTDGHTASLFPHAPGLEGALDPASRRTCKVVDPPAAPHLRLTLTARALLSARFLALHFDGEEKWEVFRRAVADGPTEEMPVRAVLRRASAGVEVYGASSR